MRSVIMFALCPLLIIMALQGGSPCIATVDPISMPCPAPDSIVIGQLDADVTGDGINDRVILMGRKLDKASRFIVEMSIIITDLDGKNELCTRLPQESDSGYDPQLKAMDFTGDGAHDIFISSPTGGSGGIINYIIYSYSGRMPKLLLDTNHTVIPAFTGHLLPGYKAQITVNSKSVKIDLSDRKKTYDETGYYKNGKLLKPTDVWGGGYALITPVDIDHDGIYELHTVQEVHVTTNADRIAEIISIIKWEKGEWKIISEDIRKK